MNNVGERAQTLEDDLLEVLRSATATPSVTFDGRPGRLSGGFWAELVSFRLHGAPVGWQGDLVARVMPDPGTAAKETAIQAEVAAQGYPTPAVHLAGGPEDGVGQAFMIMDLATGGPLLGGLDGLVAIRALPRLARRLPKALATAMARLHGLDPEPVRARLSASGGRGLGIELMVAGLADGATVCNRADLAAAARWLEEHPPPAAPEVICHGDLHPFNLLVAPDDTVTVLDWSAGLVAPAAYDVAFTSLLLSEPPLAVPSVARPLVRAAGRHLARRFRAIYARTAGTEIVPTSLRWHEGVVCLRALVEVAGWISAGTANGRDGHPWIISGPAFAARLAALTGTPVTPR